MTYRRFIYDGDRLIEERTNDGLSVLVSYVYGAGRHEVLSRRHWFLGSTTDLFYHTNSLGSVVAVTDVAGEVRERYKYDAYGKPTFLKPDFSGPSFMSYLAAPNNILFAGAYYDGESGNYYMVNREYDPYLGRFLQRDPLGESASLNLYAYVFDNPINDTDPTGMLSGMMAQWYNEMHGMENRGWARAEAAHGRAAQQAEEAMRKLHGYTAMEDEHEAGIAQMEAEYWAGRQQEQQAKKDTALGQQIGDSLKKSAPNMEHPTGVLVIIYGLWQRISGEYKAYETGTNEEEKLGKTDLDQLARDARAAGKVVIEVQADSLAKAGDFSEPSASGIAMLTKAVLDVTKNGSSDMKIEIQAFSRGGGGAVALTNSLTAAGLSGSRIFDTLNDPYMGADSNWIRDPGVNVTVTRSGGWHPRNAFVNLLNTCGAPSQNSSARRSSELIASPVPALRSPPHPDGHLPVSWRGSWGLLILRLGTRQGLDTGTTSRGNP